MKRNLQIQLVAIGLAAVLGPTAIGQNPPTSEQLFFSRDRPLLPPPPGAKPKMPQSKGGGVPMLPSETRREIPNSIPIPSNEPLPKVPAAPAKSVPTGPDKIVPGVNNSEMPGIGTGAISRGGSQANAYAIEETRPERVKVFPDDPDSAWWEINPHYAFLRAEREQKPLLLLMTGDWNPTAMRLSEEVFSTKSFNEYVKENLIICYLNYPRNITDASQPLRDWKEKFKVKGYPNVLIFNPKGEVDCHLSGYKKGKAVDYFNRLKQQTWPILEQSKYRKKMLGKHGYRDWQGGEKDTIIFAKFIRRDPDLVTLMGVNGEQWTVSIKTLSEDDRAFAASFPTIDEVVGAK
ncbi:hypothetical protein OAK81_01565 [Verrucomicrobiales bacterium]|nr:hypothetical protein [Verrucomicrobiales bacterium]